MKRFGLVLAAGMFLASMLSGCVIAHDREGRYRDRGDYRYGTTQYDQRVDRDRAYPQYAAPYPAPPYPNDAYHPYRP